jgi:hypothetical protein
MVEAGTDPDLESHRIVWLGVMSVMVIKSDPMVERYAVEKWPETYSSYDSQSVQLIMRTWPRRLQRSTPEFPMITTFIVRMWYDCNDFVMLSLRDRLCHWAPASHGLGPTECRTSRVDNCPSPEPHL